MRCRLKSATNSKYVQFGISLEPETLEAINAIKGDITQTLWIRRAVHEKLERDAKAKKEQR
jgi:hypothetical protein